MEPLRFEQALIGAVLLDNHVFFDISDIVSSEMFSFGGMGKIWEVIGTMIERGEPVDTLTLVDAVKKAKVVKVLVHSQLVECMEAVESVGSVSYYAREVRDVYFKEQYEKASLKISDIVKGKENLSAKEMFDQVTQVVFAMKEGDQKSGFFPFQKAVDMMHYSFEADTNIFIQTGYRGLDNIIQGYRNGNLIVIGSRPSIGKTSTVLKSIINIIEIYDNKIPVGFFSLEQGEIELAERATAIRAGIPLSRLQRKQDGYPDGADKGDSSYWTQTEWLRQSNIYIDTSTGIPFKDLLLRAIKLHTEKHIGILFIDYLSLITPPQDAQKLSYNYQVGKITMALKGLARRLNIPVVLLVQTKRETEKRPGGRSYLSDIKDSGNIEQDSDVIVFLERDDEFTRPEDKGELALPQMEEGFFPAKFVVIKHRNGAKGEVEMQFNSKTVEFVDIPEEEEAA